ncbi:SDR family mycofactocin-dependent oxidoreductase [Jatrophihabitans endophyticus]|uniref:SDR family mycofactocin-dependent oxidoreductase n=1 Tax=Jatrophihabitans endophyticus TaxID=1206085 RepID=A0A1M5PS31_9ACTN|nr:mycofactocin-coupled SDR family oxidoreductase [Jatrophihabitans endophyticus]SHH04615.1 SDR family mycofactocin-dependent oxidoreductase [Jatrophihabitans endophyticus]
MTAPADGTVGPVGDRDGWAGKVALITGAARGQGRSHALALAARGVDVVAVDICEQIETVPYPLATKDDLEQTAADVERAGARCLPVVADVRDRSLLLDAVERARASFGRLDIAVANAGVAQGYRDDDGTTPEQQWSDYLAVNLTGVWNTVTACAPAIVDGGRGGSIILINSTSGIKSMSRGEARSDAYTAAKHGGVGLMKAYAIELGPVGVRVNAVHPTAVATPMTENDAMRAWVERNVDRVANGFRDAMHVGRVQPADITEAVLWLASDASRYVTGVSLPVDAGFTIV